MNTPTDSRKDGGPAFPQIETTPRDVGGAGNYATIGDTYSVGGMTLRDYFAAKALTGILSAKFDSMVANVPESCRYSLAAQDAYALADEMLAARSKP